MGIREVYSGGLAWLFGQLRAAFDQSETVALIELRAPAGSSDADIPVAANVPCLVKPLSAEVVATQDRDVGVPHVRIYFLGDPGITRAHRITVSGAKYLPVAMIAPDVGSGLYYVDCTTVPNT